MTKPLELAQLPSFIEANTTSLVVNATSYAIGSSFVANTTGVYHTGIVNASSIATTGFVANTTAIAPTSNTILLGNSTNRFVLSANTGSFSGAVSGITTLAAGNTTITGFVNATSTIQGGSSLTIAGAASGITTLAAGNTTITGFANASVSVNSALLTVGTLFIANTTGAYHTGTVNAASFTTTNFIANTSGSYPSSNSAGNDLGSTTQRWILNANTINASGLITGSAGATIAGQSNLADVTISGNLTVSGTTTYINTTTLNVGDNIVSLNADLGAGVAPTENAGLEINRGSAANVSFSWNETSDSWTSGNNDITGYANATVSVNSALLTVGSSFIANTTGAYHTGTVNAASFTVGSSFIANSSALTTVSNTATIGTTLYVVANGSVGVGTASPATKLDVSGQITTRGSTGALIAESRDGSGAAWSLYNPTGDDLRIFGNSLDRLVLDNSGNMGLGIASPTDRLDIRFASGTGNLKAGISAGNNIKLFNTAGDLSIASSDSGSDVILDSQRSVMFKTANTERMRIDSSGNLLVNTTNAGVGGLSVSNAKNINFAEDATSAYATLFRQSSSAALCLNYGLQIGTGADTWASSIGSATARSTIAVGPGTIKFFTDTSSTVAVGTNITPTERMRIDSTGALYIGKTGASATLLGWGFGGSGAGGSVFTQVGTNEIFTWNNTVTNGTAIIDFRTANVSKGDIRWNNTSTTYGTGSDYRLKNTITPMTGALAKVALLKPCTFKWNVDGSNGQGFIAHELQAVVPECVTGEKDAVETYTDEDGNEQTRPKYQGIDTSFLVATLTAAIQEQQAIITQLQADVAALKNPT